MLGSAFDSAFGSPSYLGTVGPASGLAVSQQGSGTSPCYKANRARLAFLRATRTGEAEVPSGMSSRDVYNEVRLIMGRIQREEAGELQCPWRSVDAYNTSQFGNARGTGYVPKNTMSGRYNAALQGDWENAGPALRSSSTLVNIAQALQRNADAIVSKQASPVQKVIPSKPSPSNTVQRIMPSEPLRPEPPPPEMVQQVLPSEPPPSKKAQQTAPSEPLSKQIEKVEQKVAEAQQIVDTVKQSADQATDAVHRTAVSTVSAVSPSAGEALKRYNPYLVTAGVLVGLLVVSRVVFR